MRISAKVDYAVRAAVQLAAAEGSGPVKGDEIAAAQDIPINFLENILSLLAQRRVRDVAPRCRRWLLARRFPPTASRSPTSSA